MLLLLIHFAFWNQNELNPDELDKKNGTTILADKIILILDRRII